MDDPALTFAAGKLMHDDRIRSNFPQSNAGVNALVDDKIDEASSIVRRVAP